jgi:hypothetical protein
VFSVTRPKRALVATAYRQSIDTGRRRDADAARVRAAAGARFALFPRLRFYTLPLCLPAGTSLHSVDASRAARLMVECVFGAAPARWKLEQGRAGSLHVHVVSPLPPVAVHAFDDVRPVYDLRRLLAYLSKPADARLCRTRLTPYTPDAATRAAEYRAALTDAAAARASRQRQGKNRLPPVSGWTGVRPSADRSPLHHARLLLALSLLACAYLLARRTGSEPRPEQIRPNAARTALKRLSVPRLRPARTHEPYAPDRRTRGLTL